MIKTEVIEGKTQFDLGLCIDNFINKENISKDDIISINTDIKHILDYRIPNYGTSRIYYNNYVYIAYITYNKNEISNNN